MLHFSVWCIHMWKQDDVMLDWNLWGAAYKKSATIFDNKWVHSLHQKIEENTAAATNNFHVVIQWIMHFKLCGHCCGAWIALHLDIYVDQAMTEMPFWLLNPSLYVIHYILYVIHVSHVILHISYIILLTALQSETINLWSHFKVKLISCYFLL